MTNPLRLAARILPFIVTMTGVLLLAGGLLSYTALPTAGDELGTPGAIARPGDPDAPGTDDPGDPGTSGDLEAPGDPGPSDPGSSAPPGSASPAGSLPVGASGSPATPTAGTTPPASPPSGSQPPSAPPTPVYVARATRVVVPSLKIDLPIVPGDLEVPGNPDGYPLCDVAQYLTTRYGQPSQEGTTYIYAHARKGMFLPLFDASVRRNGASMIGALVQVYTEDGRVYLYEIFRVKRHSTDFAIADEVAPGERRLVMQTSEGPRGHVPKLQVAARLLTSQPADLKAAKPRPRPKVCY